MLLPPLIELPPAGCIFSSFRSRQRPDFCDKIVNLGTLNWGRSTVVGFSYWDCSDDISDLCRWPLVLDIWPSTLLLRGLQFVYLLPSTTFALDFSLDAPNEAHYFISSFRSVLPRLQPSMHIGLPFLVRRHLEVCIKCYHSVTGHV